jgi:hypothetical protein
VATTLFTIGGAAVLHPISLLRLGGQPVALSRPLVSTTRDFLIAILLVG